MAGTGILLFLIVLTSQIVFGSLEFCKTKLELEVSNLKGPYDPLPDIPNSYSITVGAFVQVKCLSRHLTNISFEGKFISNVANSTESERKEEVCYEVTINFTASDTTNGKYQCTDSSGERVSANIFSNDVPDSAKASLTNPIKLIPFPPNVYRWENTKHFYTNEKFQFQCNASRIIFIERLSWEFGLKNGSRIPATVINIIENKDEDKLYYSETVLLMFNYLNIDKIICSAEKHDSNETQSLAQPIVVKQQIPPQMNTADEVIDFDYEKESFTINCSARGVPTPYIIWKKNGQDLPEGDPWPDFFDGISFLKVPLSNDYLVNYTCIGKAEVTIDDDVKSKNILVKYHKNIPPPPEKMDLDWISIVVLLVVLTFIGLIPIFINTNRGANYLKKWQERREWDDNVNQWRLGKVGIKKNEEGDFCPLVYLPYPREMEIPEGCIQVGEKQLGKGNFGVVTSGTLTWGDIDAEEVAVKKPVKKPATVEVLQKFLRELKILNFVRSAGLHPNIVTFFGGVVEGIRNEVYIVMEYCAYGDLKTYLQMQNRRENIINAENELIHQIPNYCRIQAVQVENEEFQPNIPTYTVTLNDAISWCLQIARGMAHLAAHKIIHMDLAARNILLNSDGVPKITDFGLSKDLLKPGQEYYRALEGFRESPVRWLAPEALSSTPKFSEKSDVWAFGVTMWEIFSFGAEPYPNIRDDVIRKLLEFFRDGHRLEKPDMASEAVYDIMKSCWEMDESNRPSFAQLADSLNTIFLELNAPPV